MGKGGSDTVTSSTNIPSWIEDLAKQNVEDVTRIADRPYQSYDLPRIASFTPDTMNAFDAVRNAQGVWQPVMDQAVSSLSNVGSTPVRDVAAGNISARDVNPMMIDADRIAAERTMRRTMSGPGDVRAATFPGSDTGAYMNPFLSAALAPTLREINESSARAQSELGGAMAASGAFGGDRQAILEGELEEKRLQALSDATGGLMARGFDTAAGLQQSDANRMLQAALANQQTGFNVGSTNLQALLGTDRANADRMLAASSANQDATLRARLANQSTDLSAQQGNQRADIDVGRANQDAAMRAALANQQADIQRGNWGLSAGTALAGLAPQLSSLAYGDAAQLGMIGEAQRQMGQSSLDLAYGDFLRQQAYPLDQINMRTAVMNAQPYSVSQTTPVQGEGAGSIMKGIGSIIGGAAGFMGGGPAGAYAGSQIGKGAGQGIGAIY